MIFISCGAYVNCAIIVMLYTHSIGNQPQDMMWCLKCVCNVSRLWSIWLIPSYTVATVNLLISIH